MARRVRWRVFAIDSTGSEGHRIKQKCVAWHAEGGRGPAPPASAHRYGNRRGAGMIRRLPVLRDGADSICHVEGAVMAGPRQRRRLSPSLLALFPATVMGEARTHD